MKRSGLALAIAAVFLTAACASTSRVYLRPVEAPYPADGARNAAVRYTFSDETGDIGVQIDGAGFATRYDPPQQTLAGFVFRVRNDSDVAAVLAVPSFTMKDDEQTEFASPYLDQRETEDAAPVLVRPGEHGSFTVVFDVTGKTDPMRVGSVVLDWAIRIGDADQAVTTKFVRYDVYDRPRPLPVYPYYPYYSPQQLRRESRLHPGRSLVWVPYEPDWYDPFVDDPWFWDD